ncbi:uncharacterized protein LOC111706378 [Eurytemora carolleeae]|uniref:uncharacterized protein LOC111706378 n=1 Tax=Eurytemora carolleeae TaxID=1294199 RepID=UPI000C781B65|nr:uncharacterized protein LOC111706378 [Eurytemora carolleeae]|eukprot:XP_023335007.1 uncharacterized protein LOC111706378 [Eurytemora affinis]
MGWCALTGPCCCGPCETRVTKGSEIVFLLNTGISVIGAVFSLILYHTMNAFLVGILFTIMLSTNLIGAIGIKKSNSFLPVPATWRANAKFRDRSQHLLLVPWILVYGILTTFIILIFVPVSVLCITKTVHWGFDYFTFGILCLEWILAILLPYQLSVVYRCYRVVRKGGQNYIAPEPQEIDTRSINSLDTQISNDSTK